MEVGRILLAGGLAGSLSAFVSYPFDIVKTRLQTTVASLTHPSTRQIVRQIQAEGHRATQYRYTSSLSYSLLSNWIFTRSSSSKVVDGRVGGGGDPRAEKWARRIGAGSAFFKGLGPTVVGSFVGSAVTISRRLTSPLPSPLVPSHSDELDSTSAPQTPLGMRHARLNDRDGDASASDSPDMPDPDKRDSDIRTGASEAGAGGDVEAASDRNDKGRDDSSMSGLSIGLGRPPPRRFSLATASRVISTPLSDRDFSPSSTTSTSSPQSQTQPQSAYPSPDQSPELPTTSHFLDLPTTSPSRFSSFDSTSTSSSAAPSSTASTDDRFQYHPPPLPPPPLRPERPPYGQGTIPAGVPSPLLHSPPVDFVPYVRNDGPSYFGKVDNKDEAHPLAPNPPSVASAAYTFPPLPMRAPSPPPPTTSDSDTEAYGPASSPPELSPTSAFFAAGPPPPASTADEQEPDSDSSGDGGRYPPATTTTENEASINKEEQPQPQTQQRTRAWSAGLGEGGLGHGFRGGLGIAHSGSEQEEEDMVPLTAFAALQRRAVEQEEKITHLETSLRISNLQAQRRREREERRSRGVYGTIEELMFDLGVDVDNETPILFSPGFVNLPKCPHCHRDLPTVESARLARKAKTKAEAAKRNVIRSRHNEYDDDESDEDEDGQASKGDEWEHLDAWRTEHWACLPFVTKIMPWAQK
ncbi:hypothetical protein RQP46_003595 [Phenoliferia psychrophenolica]